MNSSSRFNLRAALMMAALLLACSVARAADPHVSSAFPAGGQLGTTVELHVSGQMLGGCDRVWLDGSGVRAEVIGFVPGLRPLKPAERKEVVAKLAELGVLPDARRAGRRGVDANSPRAARPRKGDQPTSTTATAKAKADHQLLTQLDTMNETERRFVAATYLQPIDKGTIKRLPDTVLVAVTIAPTAAPGPRELRLLGRAGLTNAFRFDVGRLPEVIEVATAPQIPRGRAAKRNGAATAMDTQPAPPTAVAALPAVLNGRILPGETDRYRFTARKGQKLVARVEARSLNPFLADAVPGWFQAVVALCDARDGHEIAYADDYQFQPDPVVFLEIPADGEYTLEIRDALMRGRDDFVYRVLLGEGPFVTGIYPLGGRAGVVHQAQVQGWNLKTAQLALDTRTTGGALRTASLEPAGAIANAVAYTVDTMPEVEARESEGDEAMWVSPPQIIDGRIDQPGDRDSFRFHGRAGQRIIAEVVARRLGSPLDSSLSLYDEKDRLIASNDDSAYTMQPGVLTHAADSVVSATLDHDGDYRVEITDAQSGGGPVHAYRLRISPPQPDFELWATPSSVNLRAGQHTPIVVHVRRRDGFDGEIRVAPRDTKRYLLSGGVIPAGQQSVTMTLAPLQMRDKDPQALVLEGRAEINGRTVLHRARPADDLMQAFIYQHLVPRQLHLACVLPQRGAPRLSHFESAAPLTVAPGRAVPVRLDAPPGRGQRDLQFQLSNPPPGIVLEGPTTTSQSMTFVITAQADAAPGWAGNLLIEASAAAPPSNKRKKEERVTLGMLPALPIQIQTAQATP